MNTVSSPEANSVSTQRFFPVPVIASDETKTVQQEWVSSFEVCDCECALVTVSASAIGNQPTPAPAYLETRIFIDSEFKTGDRSIHQEIAGADLLVSASYTALLKPGQHTIRVTRGSSEGLQQISLQANYHAVAAFDEGFES